MDNEKNKPFDLEAAKAGEPVECNDRGHWVPAYFVGLTFRGVPFIQLLNGSSTPIAPHGCHESELRMAPKKVKVRFRVALFSELGGRWLALAESDSQVEFWEKTKTFKQWLTDWQEVEIPQ